MIPADQRCMYWGSFGISPRHGAISSVAHAPNRLMKWPPWRRITVGGGAPLLGVIDPHAEDGPAALQRQLVDAQVGQLVHGHELHRAPHPGADPRRGTEPAHPVGGVRAGEHDEVIGTDAGCGELGPGRLGGIGLVEDGQRPAGRVADQPLAHFSFAAWAVTASGIISMARSGQ